MTNTISDTLTSPRPAPVLSEAEPAIATPTGRGRNPALDGLRGVAVGAVVLYHLQVRGFTGGFLGVDIFFVLSGFLITSLLIGEWRSTGGIRLGSFWLRRAQRLLPALLLVLVALAAYCRFATSPATLARTRGDLISVLSYTANWHFIFAGRSYFARTAQPSLLQHTWSLAIEEQFYLVWPVIAVLVMRRAARPVRALFVVAVIGSLASAVEMAALYRPGTDPSRVYFGADTHAQSILIGCAAAAAVVLWGPVRTAAGRASLKVAGTLAFIAVCWTLSAVRSSDTLLYRGGFLAVAVLTAVAIASLVQQHSPTGRALASAPLRSLGIISYAVYLWHWPALYILTGARTHLHGPALDVARIAATLVVSTASFFLLERPVRHLRLAVRRRQAVVSAGALALSCLLVLALAGTFAAAGTVPHPAAAAPTPASGVAAGPPSRVLVVGDSVALTLAFAIQPYAGAYAMTVLPKGGLGCGIVGSDPTRIRDVVAGTSPVCSQWDEAWTQQEQLERPAVTVALIGRWDIVDRFYDGRWQHVGDPDFDRHISDALAQAIATMTSTGGKAVFLTAPYYNTGEQPDGSPWPEDATSRVDAFNNLLRAAAAASNGRATVIELGKFLDPQGHFTTTVDGVDVRTDDGIHIPTGAGSLIASWLLPQIRSTLGR